MTQTPPDDKVLEYVLSDRERALRLLDKLDAEAHLVDFARVFWSILEPGRKLLRGWLVDAIFEHLEAVDRGEIRKLLMNVPPGCMKSLATDVFFPAWQWGPRDKPHTRYLCASYSHDLTIRDNVRTRNLIGSQLYQELWGDRFAIDPNQDAKVKFSNDKRGYKIATSVYGLGTGERGDVVIVDDPHNVIEAESDAKRNGALQWFTEVMPSRVNDADAKFIVIMQRVHENDVSGLILEKELGYTHLCLPMRFERNHPYVDPRRSWSGWRGDPRAVEGELAFPERFTPSMVDEMEKAMMAWGGTYAVAGQMQQRPEPRGGGMVQEDWFEIVDEIPKGPITWCRGWDFASTEGGEGAGSASVKVGEWWTPGDALSDLIVADCWWDRVSPGGLYARIAMTLKEDGYGVFQSFPQDPGQAGKYQMSDLLAILSGYDFEFSLESGDKVSRFRPWAAQAETRARVGRKIKILKSVWTATFMEHLTKFPVGRFKDVPDATSRAYGGIVRRGAGEFLIGGSTLLQQKSASDGQN